METKHQAPSALEHEVETIAREVLADAGVDETAAAEGIEYLKQRVLRKPLRTIHIWGLAVGVVITGEYFGWNFGLPVGGPLGVLIAALVVSLLYLTWVLTLTELSVAIPLSGGPYAYGRRAAGKFLGFIMGWSFFLECFFATTGTALATGAYVAFLFNRDNPSLFWTTVFAVLAVVVFFFIQAAGVKEQATIMLWLTYAAIVALVWFWLGTSPKWATSNIVTHPLLPQSWTGVLGAVPYALWFLVIIETVALAPEETEEPHRSIPVGMTLGQLTLIVLVIFTVVSTAAAYGDFGTNGSGGSAFPLSFVFNKVYPGNHLLVLAFGALAVSGMVVSYNGMIYATTRQSYALGRGGYLPKVFGTVHATTRTPMVSLAVWSAVAIAFIVWGYWNTKATATAILISTFTALVWYVLAVACLFLLRRREPALARPYRVPVYPWLPVFVALLSVFAAYYYAFYNRNILWWTLSLYVAAALYFFGYARHRVEEHAPEEVTARIARELARRGVPVAGAAAVEAAGGAGGPRSWSRLEWVAGLCLAAVAVALLCVLAMAYGVVADDAVPVATAITVLVVVLGAALAAVTAVALVEVRKRTSRSVAPATARPASLEDGSVR
jgi:ethanolamine permease